MHLDIRVRAGGGGRLFPHSTGNPAWTLHCTHTHATTRDSKPQLWTGHTSPRFRNNPYHATTARPLSQDPSTLHDAAAATSHVVATHPRLVEAHCSGCQDAGGHVRWVLLGRWFLFVSFPSPGSDSLLLENPRAQGALVPYPLVYDIATSKDRIE